MLKHAEVTAVTKTVCRNLLQMLAHFQGFSKGISAESPMQNLNGMTDFSQGRIGK